MDCLAINPYHGGSHRAFVEALTRHSRHQWAVVQGKPVHWKWRMRSSPLALRSQVGQQIDANGDPDLVLCSDMLDLPAFWGMMRDPGLMTAPTVVYFHESQWSYPQSPHARPDLHYGYTNLQTALAADECWFNSQFHRADFLQQSEEFVRRMPDSRSEHRLDRLSPRCRVFHPGFDPPPVVWRRFESKRVNLGWVSRWEHDKRPDLFLALLESLENRGVDFELTLLGERGPVPSPELRTICERFSGRITHNGFAESTRDYQAMLGRIDVVVSTADHEFFGIAVCQAIWAGAIPVLPRRLSYPELTIEACLYDSIEDASRLVEKLADREQRERLLPSCRDKIAHLQAPRCVALIDSAIDHLVSKPRLS